MSRLTPHTASLARLLDGIVPATAYGATTVSGVAADSRRVEPGFAFLACRGLRSHGLDFVDEALRRGCGVLLWEPVEGRGPPKVPEDVLAVGVPDLARHAGDIAARFHGDPSASLKVVGITGTNGKTSCAWLTASALAAAGQSAGIIGTLGSGLFGALRAGRHTTPDAVSIQEELAAQRDGGAAVCAMEVSSHALEQGRVNGVHFAVGAFTNLSRDHLDYHGSMAAYARAKARLFMDFRPPAAVINGDDPEGRRLLAALGDSDLRVLAYSLDPDGQEGRAALRAESIDLLADGLRMRVAMGADRALLESRLLGRFNAANLLAVCGILLALGHSLGEACQLLAEAGPVPGRMEVVGGGNLPVVVVDYAHTPDALEKALTAAREHCSGRLIVVFGCGGDRDRGKRALMGRAAARLADRAIVTDDNPRHEDPQRIVDDILQGIAGGDVTVERDRPRAIALALADATVGDIVLVAGKGHEDYQIVGDERRPYSDRQEVANWLARQSARGNASPPAERGHC